MECSAEESGPPRPRGGAPSLLADLGAARGGDRRSATDRTGTVGPAGGRLCRTGTVRRILPELGERVGVESPRIAGWRGGDARLHAPSPDSVGSRPADLFEDLAGGGSRDRQRVSAAISRRPQRREAAAGSG